MDTSSFFSEQLQNCNFTRIVAFGSSNTERRIAGMHWFDCFEVAYRRTLGSHTVCINSGIGGDSTIRLLDRMERDCLDYQPNLVFVTVGGNDSNPINEVSVSLYRENLRLIIQRIQSCGGYPVLQTYYSIDAEKEDPERISTFALMMDIVRELSRETDCMLIDHLARWERLRKGAYSVYLRLMEDAWHVNAAGNLVLGVDIARAFSLQLPDEPCFREAWTTQVLLDELAQMEAKTEGCICG